MMPNVKEICYGKSPDELEVKLGQVWVNRSLGMDNIYLVVRPQMGTGLSLIGISEGGQMFKSLNCRTTSIEHAPDDWRKVADSFKISW